MYLPSTSFFRNITHHTGTPTAAAMITTEATKHNMYFTLELAVILISVDLYIRLHPHQSIIIISC